ncbi:hypothetical protein ACFFMN_12275 [Planobispora siamensis]|uniref:Protein kinase domain-containing protein n=1 Tax=Planobispora siamensis TaxID=936338 RepID=A0A8J3S8G8_9ACTN|nr:hypothetical protein [Planobispora siamensis]GIH89872.1 hypothetical protein Psi01_05020 [Planobispora siamensis]
MNDPGLLAGRYRLLERRDPAGMSWRSRDELLQRDVTVTEVRLPPPGPYRDRLLGQLRAAAELRHPGVVTLHDVVPAPDRMWLILEAVAGRSLAQTVRADGPLPTERAAEVGLAVLDALTAAQRHGVSLTATPDTILLGPDGRVVLTGVAAAPADELRDLGTALFTAVEGHLPGTRSAFRTADGTPLASPETGSTGSGPLAPLLDGLLSADPAHRPDADSVRLTLESLAPRASSARRRTLLAVTTAVVCALVITGGVMWSMRGATTPAAVPTPAASYVDPGPFRATPPLCELFAAEQLAQLDVDGTPSNWGKGCIWGPARRDDPRSLQRQLSVDAKLYPEAAEATRAFAARLDSAARSAGAKDGSTQTAPHEVGGLGNEAFTGEVVNSGYGVTAFVRVNNLIVTVQYQRNAGEPAEEIERGALTAARWAVEALVRGN